jgi:hypothetical protein
MANLIITVIAIALVAVASLMGAYYGGSAFSNNQSTAAAATVVNMGQQVAGAFTSYQALNNSLPKAWSDLTGGGYLAAIPDAPAVPGSLPANRVGIYEDNASRWWMVIDVGVPAASNSDAVCKNIIKTATGTAPAVVGGQGFTDSDMSGITYSGSNGRFGCGIWGGGTPPVVGAFADNPVNPTADDYYFWYDMD